MQETPQKLRPIFRANKKPHSLAGVRLNNTNALKERLVKEMLVLSKQRQELESGAEKVDFSMVQTYKEMINSRRSLLNQLNTNVGN